MTGASEGADIAPSRSCTAIGPATAPNGTRTSADVLRRTTIGAVTSSSSPAAPRNRTSSARVRVFPRTRSNDPGWTAPPPPQSDAHRAAATDAADDGTRLAAGEAIGVATGAGAGVGLG